jgi:hypothetical protein
LIPLFVVEKNHERNAYYTAVFIASTRSDINNLAAQEIHRLVLAPPNSGSGFIAPLYRLCELGVIASPTPAAAKARGWDVDTVADRRDILDEVRMDPGAIGSIGQPAIHGSPGAGLKVIDHNQTLPQDVLFISRDLEEQQDQIQAWLRSTVADSASADLLARSSSGITGLVPYAGEMERKIEDLERMRSQIARGDAVKCSKFNWKVDLPEPVRVNRWIAIILGVSFAIVGIVLFARMGAHGENMLKIGSMEFKLTGSALVIFVLGVILILVGLGVNPFS